MTKTELTELENCIYLYGKDIYSFCKTLAIGTQDADDLYQDTFLKAAELSGRIDYRKNPKSYLLSIAIRLWKNKKSPSFFFIWKAFPCRRLRGC